MDSELYQRPKNKPAGFQPDFDTFHVRYKDGMRTVVRAIFGIENRGGDASQTIKYLRTLFNETDGPQIIERGTVIGGQEELFFCYWVNREAYQRWNTQNSVRDFFENDLALSGDIGRWRETGIISLTHHETNYSHDVDLTGFSALDGTHREKCDLCGYWGAARDRIPISAEDPLLPYGEVRVSSLGKRATIEASGNMCVIRTSQDWIGAPAAHRDWYLSEVEPVLHTGADFLRDHRAEAGTFAARYIRETTLDGAPLDRTCVLGYFHSLADLEKWTHTHPTHLAIYEAGMKLIYQFGADLGVRLYHEVTIFPRGQFDAEYVNCSNKIGLLQAL
jgi:aldoxime dehydratase